MSLLSVLTTAGEFLLEHADLADEIVDVISSGVSKDAVKQANWGVYQDWFLREQQASVAIRRVYDEIEGKLPQR